jgi:hypothetical protein
MLVVVVMMMGTQWDGFGGVARTRIRLSAPWRR